MADPNEDKMGRDFVPSGSSMVLDRIATALEYIAYQLGQMNRKQTDLKNVR